MIIGTIESLWELAGRLSDKGYTIAAPVENRNRIVFSSNVEPRRIRVRYVRSFNPPFSILLPQGEALFSWSVVEGELVFEEPLDSSWIALFCVKPCDLHALMYLDRALSMRGYYDVPYYRRRARSIIVAVDCIDSDEHCFCAALGAYRLSGGYDLLIRFTEDGKLAFEAGSPTGHRLIEENKDLFEVAEEVELKPGQPPWTRTAELLVKARDKLGKITGEEFEELASKCFNCGVCTLMCPTCTCFDIYETGRMRRRRHASCMNPAFEKIASGEEKETTEQRFRRRLLCNFVWSAKATGHPKCVGCGRCSAFCTAGITMEKLLEAVVKP